jgi:Alginate export
MSKFLKLMSVLAIVALIAVPAFAEVQNVKVSGDIDSKMITRNNYDLGSSVPNTNDNDTWFTSTARVQIDADLTDNVSTCVRLLNERDWTVNPNPGAGTAGETAVTLDLANVKMKEMFYAPLTLTIGKQNLRFGSGLVVGDPDTNDASVNTAVFAADLSARKSFDAIRATLDYNPLVLDVIMAKIATGTIGSGHTNNDTNLYGINAAYKFNQYNSEAEAYIFQNNARSTTTKSITTEVYGVRGSLEPISKLVLNGELAMQRGTFSATQDRSAWAADAAASYAIDYKWSPKVGAGYVYRSGDKAGNTGEYKAWNTMYEDQTHGIVANQIFNDNNEGGDSNSSIITANASVNPIQDLTVAVDYYNFTLAQKLTNLSTMNSTIIMTDKKALGQEVDLSLGYDYTEDVKLGLTAGFFLPGKAFSNVNDSSASTVVADVKVSF